MERALIRDGYMVAVALQDLTAGEAVEVGGAPITQRSEVLFGHKVAICHAAEGEPVSK